MVTALVTLLLAATPAQAAAASATVRAEGHSHAAVQPLAGADDVVRLCRRLVPAERLKVKGDAVTQGEARAKHDAERAAAITGRYAMTVPAGKISFAPYDGPEQQLEVAEPATLRLGAAAVLTATLERGLPVHVNAATARRVLAAQRAGQLSLRLVFDLPDDAICAADPAGRKFDLGVEPVEWTWLEGETALAWGGVAGDRPAMSRAVGAEPAVEVGEPIAGPSEAKAAVIARRAELVACYAAGLEREPSLDGVVVVDVGAKIAVAADSTGSAELERCVENALAPLAGGAAASVPIRFELGTTKAEPAAEGAGAE
jgi:hypothetical protein